MNYHIKIYACTKLLLKKKKTIEKILMKSQNDLY